MIKLVPAPAPEQLTEEVIESLTQEFVETGKDVWNKSFLRKDLLEMGKYKCCYCECYIDEESKYMEVDHFKPKQLFPLQVVVWQNLLPSCKRCNDQKGSHNTELEPIINPSLEIPKNHLKLKAYRIKVRGQSQLGRTTINVLNLNEQKRLVDVRFRIGEEIQEKLEGLLIKLEDYGQTAEGSLKKRRKTYITNTIKNLLYECQPNTEYSATAATMLLQDDDYQSIKEALVTYQIWDAQLQNLEDNAVEASLE